MFNLDSCQCSCNSAKGNHQEQKLAENVMGLPTSTNDKIKAGIMTKNNEEALTENNHILDNNNKSNLNRRDKLLKNDNTDKEKRVPNINKVQELDYLYQRRSSYFTSWQEKYQRKNKPQKRNNKTVLQNK